MFNTVPRILNKLYDKIWDSVKSKGGIKQKLFEKAVSAKQYNLKHYGSFKHGLYDKILKPVNDMFGGNVKKMVIGSAPIAEDILNFFKIVFKTHIHEGYG